MKHLLPHARLAMGLLLTLALLLAACGGGSTSTPSAASPTTPAQASVAGTFVGTVNQTGSSAWKANFGLVSNGQRFIAYLCDGGTNGSATNPAKITVVQWFKGPVANNAIQVTNAQGSQLVASLTAQSVTGTLTLNDGRTFSLQAPIISGTIRNSRNDIVGLYRDEETFGGVRYLAGTAVQRSSAYPSASVADLSTGFVLFGPLALADRCFPDDGCLWGGGFINEQTGSLFILPQPAGGVHDGVQVTVPGLGTFTLHRAQP